MSFTPQEVKIIHEVFQRIDLNYKIHIPITTLISKHNISESTLCRGFKVMYQTTIYRYRMDKCMRYAKDQIALGMQIKIIQQELGYKTTGDFARAYKKFFGYVPSSTHHGK